MSADHHHHHHRQQPPPAPHLPPPFLPTPSIANLRDAAHGLRTVRPNILLRSADPSRADADALALLRALRCSRVFDLRSKPEIEARGGAREEWGNGEGGRVKIERVWCPVFEESDYSPERIAVRFEMYGREGVEGVVAAYADILSHAGPAFATVFRHIASQASSSQPDALLVHCTAGKDRTGLFVALLLSMLGVDDERVADEYALTDVGMAHVRPFFVAHLLESPAFKDDPEGAERMVRSRKENMLATLAMVREKYGGAEAYMRTVCGLSEDEIERIRQVMIVSEKQDGDEDTQKAAL